MDDKIRQEILDALFPSLEALETQSAALLLLVKDKGLASDEEILSYFEQAGNASGVRWRAARARINYLLSAAANAEPVTQKNHPSAVEKNPTPHAGASAGTTSENDGSEASSDTQHNQVPVAAAKDPDKGKTKVAESNPKDEAKGAA